MLLSFRKLEDADLVTKAQSGDKDAFEALIGRHYQKVLVYCIRIFMNSLPIEEIEDAVLNASVEVYIKISQFQYGGSFEAWMKKTAKNRCLDAWRREKTTIENAEKHPVDRQDLASSKTPEEILIEEELTDAFEECLHGLGEKEREAMLLYSIGHSLREISRELAINRYQVKKIFEGSLQSLKRCLTKKKILD